MRQYQTSGGHFMFSSTALPLSFTFHLPLNVQIVEDIIE